MLNLSILADARALRLMTGCLATVLVGAACASTPPQNENAKEETPFKNPYPTQQRLKEIGKGKVARIEAFDGRVDATEVILTGPLPDTAVAQPLLAPKVPLQQWLIGAVEGKPVNLTENLHCVAQGNADFFVAHGGRFPGPRTRSFIEGRCGSVDGHAQIQTLSWKELKRPATEEELRGRSADGFAAALATFPMAPGASVGVAFSSTPTSAVYVFAYVAPTVQVDPFPLRPAASTARFSGTLMRNAIGVSASITGGEFGASDCVFDPSVTLPKFAFDCPVVTTDTFARLSMSFFQEGASYGNVAFSALILPSGSDGEKYTLKTYRPADAANESLTPENFLRLVNAVRRSAGLSALRLAEAQTEVAAELVPHATETIYGKPDHEMLNDIFNGMVAGWDLDPGVVIRDAGVYFSLAAPSGSELTVSDLVSTALENPGARQTYLAEGGDLLAVGLGQDKKGDYASALTAVYSPYRSQSFDRDAAAKSVAERVQALRREKGLEPLIAFGPFDASAAYAAEQAVEGTALMKALQIMLERASPSATMQLSAAYAGAHDLDKLEIPAALLQGSAQRYGIAVQYVPDAASRWGHFVLFSVREVNGSDGVVASGPAAPVALASR